MLVAFVLMLIIFHHPKAKPFCLASFLGLTKKSRLQGGKPQFFLTRKLTKQVVFALE
jgi:hypothetical protein